MAFSFGNFFQKKQESFLGVDFGTSSVKVVELAREEENLKLLTYGEIKITPEDSGGFRSAMDFSDSELVTMLKNVMEASQAGSKKMTVSVPMPSSFFTVIDFPPMPREEILQAVPIQAKQYIPVPLSEVVLDWNIIEDHRVSDENSKTQVVLVAVPKEIVNRYARLVQMVGAELRALEVEVFSLVRALIGKNNSEIVALLDLGARNTNVSIVERGHLMASHNFDVAGRNFSEAIARSLSINWQRAEEIKKQKGLKLGGEEMGIGQVLNPLLDSISLEIEKVIHLYQRRYSKEVEKFILAGGSARLPGIVDYFVERFGKEATIANPFSRISYPPILEDTIREMGPSFAVAAGLAMRELI